MEKINWDTGTFRDGEMRYFSVCHKGTEVEFNGYNNRDEELSLFVNGKKIPGVTCRANEISSISVHDLDRFVTMK